MSKLLIDSEPLQVLPQLAQAIGLNEAIFLQQLHYWLQRSKNEHDGRQWVYNTFEEWQEQFPFWSLKTMKRIAASLVAKKLLIVRKMKASDWDRTNWYSIDYSRTEALSPLDTDRVNLARSIGTNRPLQSGQIDPIITKVSETTTEITTETGAAAPKPSSVPPQIQLVRELTKRYPPKEIWSELINALGPNPSKHRLTQCWTEWRLRGFKPTNYHWLTEWYVRGIPASNGNHLPTQAEMNRGGTGKLVI